MKKRNKWTDLAFNDRSREGESNQQNFRRLKLRGLRLQKTLGAAYSNDTLLCDFFRRAMQTEPFWELVYDYVTNITSDLLYRRVANAIVRYDRRQGNGTQTRSMQTSSGTPSDILKNRWGRPDRKSLPGKNPADRRSGSPMTYTGCGSDEHLYKACNNPNKTSYRARRLQEITNYKNAKRQNQDLRSLYLQTDDDEQDAEADAKPEKDPEEGHRHVANDMEKK